MKNMQLNDAYVEILLLIFGENSVFHIVSDGFIDRPRIKFQIKVIFFVYSVIRWFQLKAFQIKFMHKNAKFFSLKRKEISITEL